MDEESQVRSSPIEASRPTSASGTAGSLVSGCWTPLRSHIRRLGPASRCRENGCTAALPVLPLFSNKGTDPPPFSRPRFKIPSSGLRTSRSPLGSKLLESRSGLPTKGSWSRFCRTRRPGRVFCRGARIRRAGCSRDRRPAGESGIDHQLLGSGRRRFTIHKVWPAAEKGYPREGPVDLGCS